MEETVLLSWGYFYPQIFEGLKSRIPGPSMPRILQSVWSNKHLLMTLCIPGGSAGKESTCNVGDLGSIPGSGRSPREGNSYPLQSSGLENSMDCTGHGVAKSQTRLSHFHFVHPRPGLGCGHRDEGARMNSHLEKLPVLG